VSPNKGINLTSARLDGCGTTGRTDPVTTV